LQEIYRSVTTQSFGLLFILRGSLIVVRFGGVLKKVRMSRKISQEVLAKSIGVSRQAVASYESGRREPCLDVLMSIADYFDISMDYLLGRNRSSIERNVETVKRNIRFLMRDKTVSEFCRELGRKTGIMIAPDKMDMYLSGRLMVDGVSLKILAMYAGVDVQYFFKEHPVEETMAQTASGFGSQ
jgi:transcriptional regulator with XRE-family HTH domain